MARIRTIKPEFFKHYELWQAEVETGLPLRVAFAGLWCVADREGRFRWLPPQIKIDVLPYDDIDFSRVLDALATRGFVVKYRVDGREYGHIPGFSRHQVVNNRERKSELPEPNETNILTRDERVDDACATREARRESGREGKGRERKGKEKGGADAPETEFAFVGHIVRLTWRDFERWKESYHAVPDIIAELRAADAYYAENPPKDGKWFYRVSQWLKREHDRVMEKRRKEQEAEDAIYAGVL